MAPPGAIERVSRELRALGALSIDEFLASSLQQASVQPSPILQLRDPGPNHNALERLTKICAPSADETENATLQFEFVGKQCILTITRPMGESRAYKSVPGCPNDEAARYSAADMAIGHGALDFIRYGDSDESKAVKGTLLVPLTQDEETTSSLTAVQRIDECAQGRATWYTFMDSNQHGAALKIQHTPHNYRVYSSEPNSSTTQQAQERRAELAISEGALEYISEHSKMDVARNTAQPWSLQSFFESLPRPLEEDFGTRNALQIQPVAWLANVHTQSPGSRFTKTYHALNGRTGHGCLLRLKHTPIDGPPTVYSYLFEPQGTTAKEAKAAVALLALSLGAGNLIRAASAASQALLSPEIRNFTTRFVFSALASETRRVNGGSPVYEYHTVDDAYGCTLNLNPDLTYTVPPQYASRTDARIAVGYLAAQQGALDILRCDGKPPPSGYTPAFEFPSGGGVPVPAAPAWARKRKNNSLSGPPAKKQKRRRSQSLEEGEVSE